MNHSGKKPDLFEKMRENLVIQVEIVFQTDFHSNGGKIL
jgi:hypothetical protein